MYWWMISIQQQKVAVGPQPSVKLDTSIHFRHRFVEVEDHKGHINAIREQLNTHKEIRFGPFVPHITLGNYTDMHNTSLIQTQIERLPLIEELHFNSVEWVEFSPAGCRKTLRCIKRIHRSISA